MEIDVTPSMVSLVERLLRERERESIIGKASKDRQICLEVIMNLRKDKVRDFSFLFFLALKGQVKSLDMGRRQVSAKLNKINE